jgi:ATP-binding cassette subfamily B protein
MSEVNANTLRRPWDFFKYVVKDHRKWLYLAVLFVVLAAALGVGKNYFFKLIIDAVESDNLKKALFFGMMYPVSVFIVQSLYRSSGVVTGRLVLAVVKSATDSLHTYLLKHNHQYYSDRFAGAVTNKIKNVTNALDQIVPDLIWSQLDTAVTFIMTFILICTVDWQAGIVFLSLVIILGIVNRRLSRRKTLLSKENAAAGTQLQAKSVDVIGNMSAVRQYARTDLEEMSLESASALRYKTGIASWMYTEKVLFANSALILGFALMMFWVLVSKWGAGLVTTSEFILVIALVSQINGTLLFIGRAVNNTARAVGELREGLEDIYVPYDITDKPGAKALVVTGGSVELEAVTFKYESNTVFDNLQILIPGTQRVGLVGPSGAGKSTLVSLLLRQHDLTSGRILIDGVNIADISQDSLRKAIAVVPQEPALFHRTIRENIAYGNPEATMAEIEQAAKLAHAHEFVSSLPLGYDTLVGERGVKLSGGQKQRVAIARAMLKNAPILILDEATSALDSESEQLIQQALHELMQGKTVIAIAHRLSTLREMDRILVLDQGRIVEDGTHTSLQKAGGMYERLWTHQAGGFMLE